MVDSEEWNKYNKLLYASTWERELTKHNFHVSLGKKGWSRIESCVYLPQYLTS